ncbi:HAMP domain-containing protein [Coleofasciculus sp. FACHB-712]|uniref:ATP-binding protein n=1 Tax=Coleofasciculus sp. FACHB-712 TaxID=2692789 RepID=UPI001683F2B0|nr:ATP-binding protein [Coleofasciculus sp. FACHB-712]MBD1945582.1 HAMP domain-containing protein [Coleofasciculus sp. FACHB-712]
MFKRLQQLQPKLLIFTFGASLLPVMFLSAVAWRFVQQPLIDLEKTRLDDQVLAFRGYTAATEKGLQNLSSSYAIWTDLYNAIGKRDEAWIKKEVSEQLVLSTDVDHVKVVDRRGEILGERGDALRIPNVAERITDAIATNKPTTMLIDSGLPQILLFSTAPVYNSDGTGKSPGTLILGQNLDETWLRNFLNFSQPTTKLQVISLDGKSIISSNAKSSIEPWEQVNLKSQVLRKIQKGKTVYRIEPKSGLNTIYAPITSRNQPIAIAKIQIVSKYFNQASINLNRVIWLGLGLATLLSIAIAHLLAKQIGNPIIQLSERSKTLAAGDLTTPIPGIGAGGEIGQLAHAYQEMAQALKALIGNLEQRVAKRTEELEQARQTLEERVQQRTEELSQKNQQLQQAHDQLQQLNTELTTNAQQLSQALRNLGRAQAQLIQTEKMSSLGQLVAGIAHEINNPINFIYGNLPHISDYTKNLLNLVQRYQKSYPDAEIQQYIEDIDLDFLTGDLPKIITSMRAGSDRIRKIILLLRNFSRLDEAERKRVNIHEGIDSSLLIVQHRLQSGGDWKAEGNPEIQVVKRYGVLPPVECYPAQLNQVFMNIFSNAIDALETFKEQPEKRIYIKTEFSAAKQIIIKIKDNGSGIPTAIKSKIFDPFFTTKPVGKGIGLGLTVCYQILEHHQGRIAIISEPGQGTEVIIELPIKLNNPIGNP